MPCPADRPRAIVHLNVTDFPAALERLKDPALAGRPVIVAFPGAARARVLDMSEEAFQAGVRKAMPLDRALRLCRGGRVVPPDPELYGRAMARLAGLALEHSPLVEAGRGDGHLYLDLTGTLRLWGPPQDTARRLRRSIRAALALDPVWTLAPNKLTAKAASRLVRPAGELIVPPGREEALLRPLPIGLLPGLEREDLLAFRDFNVSRVGQAGRWSRDQLIAAFGPRGGYIHRLVRGRDDSPVLPPGRAPQAISHERELGDDSNDVGLVEAILYGLVEKAGFELRRNGRAARRAAVQLDYSDGVRITRQRTDRAGTASDPKLFALARAALDLAWVRRVRLRRLKLVCDRLAEPPAQLELFPEEDYRSRRAEQVQAAVDLVRQRFGAGAIRTGRGLGLEGP